jgi:ABC-type Na+ efflux pump permease subunit
VRAERVRRRIVWLVARWDLADLRRQRNVWIALLLLPFINVMFLLLLPGVLTQREQTSLQRATYRVAVPAADQDVLRPALPADRFALVPDADPRRAVLDRRADVGVRFDSGAAAALAGDGQATGDVFLLAGRDRSRTAYGATSAALDRYAVALATARLAVHDLPPSVARPVVVTTADLNHSGRGRRLGLATVLPLVVLLPLTGAVGISAQRISGSKDQRVFEPLLVLPFRRVEIVLAKGLSSLLLCSITLPAAGAPLLLGRVLPIIRGGQSVALPPLASFAVMGIAGLLLVLLVALGVMIGAASRTSAELGSVLQLATLPVFLLGLFLQFRSGIETTPLLLVVPFLGPLLLVRDVAIGAVTMPHLSLAAGATAVWIVLLLSVAVRFVASERSVLRPTN